MALNLGCCLSKIDVGGHNQREVVPQAIVDINMAHLTVSPLTIDGQYFYIGDERFIARGAVYQPNSGQNAISRRDPLLDDNYTRLCQDLIAFQELNINALWVYNHDAGSNHDMCMALLAENNIYVIFETSHPMAGFERSTVTHEERLLQNCAKIIDSVSKYNNTMGVCLGRHMIDKSSFRSDQVAELCWQRLGRIVQQMKQYMRFRNHDTGQRILPLCISDEQWSSLNTKTFQYIAGSKADIGPVRPAGGRVDFYCFVHYDGIEDPNQHSFPGTHTLDLGEVEKRLDLHTVKLPASEDATGLDDWSDRIPMDKFVKDPEPIPIMISEYGSNVFRPRLFDEVRQLYGKNMDSPLLQTLSGGFVYEYTERTNNFGLVKSMPDRVARLPDFAHFRNQMLMAVGKSDGIGLEYYD